MKAFCRLSFAMPECRRPNFLVGADFDLGDFCLAERHRDRNGPRDAGVRSGVGAWCVGKSARRENDGSSDNGILAEIYESLLGPGYEFEVYGKYADRPTQVGWMMTGSFVFPLGIFRTSETITMALRCVRNLLRQSKGEVRCSI